MSDDLKIDVRSCGYSTDGAVSDGASSTYASFALHHLLLFSTSLCHSYFMSTSLSRPNRQPHYQKPNTVTAEHLTTTLKEEYSSTSRNKSSTLKMASGPILTSYQQAGSRKSSISDASTIVLDELSKTPTTGPSETD